jgi:hypothetical protein
VNLANPRLSQAKSHRDICAFHAFVVIHGQDSLRHVREFFDALGNQPKSERTSTESLVINRYIHLNPVRVNRLGGHEGRSELETNDVKTKLARARVGALRNYHWRGEQGLGSEWQTLVPGHGNGARPAALYRAQHHSDHTLLELAELTGGMEYPAVTMAIRRLGQRRKTAR